ncbi:MAG TPA: efflux transporter outer membrane subunit [Candidatus Binatia bacterium]|nr:efflux transporter outer membrane subunit [Candidatus Binatia bacterium]
MNSAKENFNANGHRGKSLSLVLGALLALVSACTVGPNYSRPAVTTPANYKEAQMLSAAQSIDDIVKANWWEIFDDAELNALELQVDVSNQNVAQAEARFRQARALVQAARAAYFPTVTVGVGVTRTAPSATAGSSTARNSQTFTDHSLPVDVSWELDVWGRIRRTVESAQANAEANVADLEAAKLSARAELAQDYFQLRSLDAQKQLLDTTAVAFQKSLDLTNNRYNSGVASRGDVLQAETQLKTTQAQAIDVGVQRAQLEHAIALLVGKAPADFSIGVAPLAVTPPTIPAGVPTELLERRPDVAASERLVAAVNAQIGVAEAAYYPTVSVNVQGGFESSSLAKWFSWMGRFWSAGVSVSQTLFDGGFRGANVDQSRAAYDATVAAYRETVLTGFQEVEDNLAAQQILANEAQAQDEAVQAAQQSLAVTMNQYQSGIVSYLNVIVAQTIALTNQRTAVDILGRRLNASVLLVKALGGGWKTA